jgi:hypothetical protein
VLACDGTVVAPHDEIVRLSPVVWAGMPASSPPLLNHNNWQDLNTGDGVKTDASGQAQLDLVDCDGQIYVFTDGIIQVSTCREEEQGLATCVLAGTAFFNVKCAARFVVDTYSARVTIAGTAFSVTYLPEFRMTLVIVFDGMALVQPVTDFNAGTLSPEEIPVPAGFFMYTVPNDQLSGPMPLRARTALPVGELAPLVEVTGTMHWMKQIEERATPAGILPPDWPFRPGGGLPVATIALLSQGGPFESADVQQAVLHALDKDAIAKRAFPEEELVLLSDVAGQELDARAVAYDPALARELLAKAGVPDGFKTALLFPAGDDQLATMAKLLVEPLAQAGIYASPEAVAPSELRVVAPLRRQAGEPVLWLERR